MIGDQTGCRGILRQWNWGGQTFPWVHSVGGTGRTRHKINRLQYNELMWSDSNQSTLAEYYLLYCWPSECCNVDDEKHFTSVVTEWNRLSIQGLSREIIDWFICHACSLACLCDCSRSRVSIHSTSLLARLIHWNTTHGSAIVQHDWLHCSSGQRWAGNMANCSTLVYQTCGCKK